VGLDRVVGVTVRRIMGIETEYGVLQQGNPYANPMLMSSQVVLGYVSMREDARRRARWDYHDEDPLQDARGFHLPRASAHPSLLTDDPSRPAPSGQGDGPQSERQLSGDEVAPAGTWTEQPRPEVETYEDPGAANAILTNGARLYVDHAHPEYSSPEVTNPRDAVVWDAAGERVMRAAAREASRLSGNPISLYKNNVDGKGASYGTHENYLVDRAVPFETLVGVLTPFFVTRQVFTGSGRVGIGPVGQQPGFQLSQRADYVEAEVGLETTLRRPIINTRDEPHAERERWRRLHVIIGDANLFEVATYLKLGTTSLVLWLAEHLDQVPGLAAELEELVLADPVEDVRRVSRDLSLRTPLRLRNGQQRTALQVQGAYLAAVRRSLEHLGAGDDDATRDVVARWGSLLDRLATDPASTAREVEWVAKHQLLDRMRQRERSDWSNPRLAALDVQWSDIRPERSIYATLVRAGAVERVITDEEADAAVLRPPANTRAYLRGEVMARFPDEVSAASWDALVFDVPQATRLRRISMSDPARGTREHVGALLDASSTAADFLDRLSRST